MVWIFFPSLKAVYQLKLIANLVQITKHVEFHMNPVWNLVFLLSMSVFHFLKPELKLNMFSWFEWGIKFPLYLETTRTEKSACKPH